MIDEIPRLMAERDPRVSRRLAMDHYASTPPIHNDVEYRHYLSETSRLVRTLRSDDPPEVVAMAWGVVDRVLDYHWQQRAGGGGP